MHVRLCVRVRVCQAPDATGDVSPILIGLRHCVALQLDRTHLGSDGETTNDTFTQEEAFCQATNISHFHLQSSYTAGPPRARPTHKSRPTATKIQNTRRQKAIPGIGPN